MKLNSLIICILLGSFALPALAEEGVVITMESLKNRKNAISNKSYKSKQIKENKTEVMIKSTKRRDRSEKQSEAKTQEDIARDKYWDRLRKIRSDFKQGKLDQAQAVQQLASIFRNKKPDLDKLVERSNQDIKELKEQLAELQKEIKRKELIAANPSKYYIFKAEDYLGINEN